MNINSDTKITGLFGDPVRHSLSPAMHNAAFKALALPYIYLPFAVAPPQLPAAVSALRALSLQGVNVTVPHKQSVIDHLDELDHSASLCGAVNTIIRDGDTLTGYNTDGTGFTDSLREASLDPHGQKVIILGAGGSARAIASQLLAEGAAELVIMNRTLTRSRQLAASLNQPSRITLLPLSGTHHHLRAAALVVNTLSVPFYDGQTPLADLSPAAGALFYDLRYGAMPSGFMHYAQSLASPTTDGISLLLHQGARAFTLFCGHEAPLAVMRQALKDVRTT